jgi:iron complex outermembrane receptor protein
MVRISSLAVRTLLYLLYTASFSILVITDAWAGDPIARFDLPARPLPQTLIEFYHQSGVEPGFAVTPQMEKTQSNPVSGVMPSSKALELLLKGTGYTYQADVYNSVDVLPVGQPESQKPAVASTQQAGSASRRLAVEQDPGRLEQVDVTGSLIHGVQDAVAPLIFLKQQQLAMASYATVEDALYSLPMISLNGPREDLGIDDNYQYGAGLDLRGLGVGATLVLINGQRQPLSGLNGDFVDVSTIPWSAVQRIEVLPDGASALYGSDAVAGVVNMIMRDDFDGADTQVRSGTAIGGHRETMASQLLGKHWSGGHAMLAYEYSDATALNATERPYAANADKTPYGGANYDSYYSNPGNILDPATLQPTFGIPSGQNGQALTQAALSSRINLENQFAQYQIFPEVRSHKLYTAVAQDIGTVQLFFNGRFAARDALRSNFPDEQVLAVPPSNPFYVNPFAGSSPYALVAYSFSRDFGPTIFNARSRVYVGTTGAKLKFGNTWQAALSESYGRQSLLSNEYNVADTVVEGAALADPDPATAFDPFGAGSNTNPRTLQAIQRDYLLHSVSSIESTRLIADGSLFTLPTGDVRIAIGGERREEKLTHDVPDPSNPTEQTISQSYDRHVTSLFSQVALPILADPTNPRAVPRLELVATGRYEHYSDFGGTFNPTVRLQWLPTESLKLRASWGRSFRAPKLDDLYDTSDNLAASVVLPDPQSPTGRSLVLVEQGSNPTLRQETANTWTAGIDLAPKFAPRATLSLTYYSIDYENRIAQPAADNPFAILVNENEWAPVINRNPSRAQIDAICNSADYQGSVSGCLASSPAAIIDGRLANLAATRTTGIDLQARDSLSGPWGRVDVGVTGNYVFEFDQAVTATSPAIDIANTITNPLALRLRGTVEWNRQAPGMPGPGFALAVNYTGGYKNPGSSLISNVSAWTTLDARVVYRTRQDTGWLSGIEVSLNGVNLFNHDPPFVDDLYGYDVYNVQALGRVVSADITKHW